MAGKSAIADAPAVTGFGAPFPVISGGIACVLTVILFGLNVPGIRRYRTER